MRLELTPEQAAEVAPALARCREQTSTAVLAGQIMPGDWREHEKVFLIYRLIKRRTAEKIRRLIEKDLTS
jgi:hypothetical protein